MNDVYSKHNIFRVLFNSTETQKRTETQFLFFPQKRHLFVSSKGSFSGGLTDTSPPGNATVACAGCAGCAGAGRAAAIRAEPGRSETSWKSGLGCE